MEKKTPKTPKTPKRRGFGKAQRVKISLELDSLNELEKTIEKNMDDDIKESVNNAKESIVLLKAQINEKDKDKDVETLSKYILELENHINFLSERNIQYRTFISDNRENDLQFNKMLFEKVEQLIEILVQEIPHYNILEELQEKLDEKVHNLTKQKDVGKTLTDKKYVNKEDASRITSGVDLITKLFDGKKKKRSKSKKKSKKKVKSKKKSNTNSIFDDE